MDGAQEAGLSPGLQINRLHSTDIGEAEPNARAHVRAHVAEVQKGHSRSGAIVPVPTAERQLTDLH